MPKKELTKDQKDRIEIIVKQWKRDLEEKVESLPPSDGKTLDGPRTSAMVKLERKYMPMIRAIRNE